MNIIYRKSIDKKPVGFAFLGKPYRIKQLVVAMDLRVGVEQGAE
jgi:hypothetical protein